MRDRFLRTIDYLRISITDRCNLRCLYCMPSEGVCPAMHRDILRYEEIARIAAVAARLGVSKIRLTGGEPLTRRNIVFLIASLKNIQGIKDLSMTTNGIFLEKFAHRIAEAGLDRVNVSLDSLKEERYRQITRGGELASVLKGLEAAKRAGLKPVKINMVPMRGINDDEISDFARMTLDTEYQVRFIECMPSADLDFWSPGKYMTTDEIRKIIAPLGPLTPVRIRKNGPSKYFRFKGAKGVIGFISALTHHFCFDCNRLRLTADGKLRPCLFSETEIDLKSAIRSGATDDEIERLLRLSIAVKPQGHEMGSRQDAGKMTVAHAAEAGEQGERSLISHNVQKRPMPKIGG
ncbi:MAG: GTP 3',8-cyclase MoaA [Nitrospirota bacterium]|nr:GTP 3',8-cyclase MoaA [Nitrospirota bacterium]